MNATVQRKLISIRFAAMLVGAVSAFSAQCQTIPPSPGPSNVVSPLTHETAGGVTTFRMLEGIDLVGGRACGENKVLRVTPVGKNSGAEVIYLAPMLLSAKSSGRKLILLGGKCAADGAWDVASVSMEPAPPSNIDPCTQPIGRNTPGRCP